MNVDIGNANIVKCHCPSTGRIGSITFENVPCLLSQSENPERKTKYTVEAISLSSSVSWIGINQGRVNDYVEFFINHGLMIDMVGPIIKLEREVKLGNSRIDFRINGRDHLEVKMFLKTLPTEGHPNHKPAIGTPPITSLDRLIKHFGDITKSKGRAMLLICNQYDALPFHPPTPVDGKISKVSKASSNALSKGLETWQVNMKIDKNGVTLLKCFKLNWNR